MFFFLGNSANPPSLSNSNNPFNPSWSNGNNGRRKREEQTGRITDKSKIY